MSDRKRDDDETPEAVARHIDDVVTDAIREAEARGGRRRGDKAPARTIPEHELACMRPGGGLHELGLKVDALRTTAIKGNLIMTAAIVLIPVVIAWWTNSRSNDRLTKQIDVAAEVAKQLKLVQEASRGRVSIPADDDIGKVASAWSPIPSAQGAE